MTPPVVAPVELVEHAAFVRRLAFHLLRDDADADDAAQETMLRAIERSPREGGGVRAWLAAVLRNVVRMRRRGDARRVAREAVRARPDGIASAHAVAARAQILRAVVSAIDALPPADREVVLLRHFEGLPPRAIGLRLCVPVATVKSRLVRAHERLRRHLDEGRGGNVEGWRGALGAFVGIDLFHRAAAAAQGAIAVGTATKVAGGVAVVACLAGGAWWLSTRDGTPPRPAEAPAPEAIPAAPGLAGTNRREIATSLAPVSEPAATSGAKPVGPGLLEGPTAEQIKALETAVRQGRIEGVVLVGTGRAKGGRVVLRLDAYGSIADEPRSPSEPVATAQIGEDGVFALGDDLGGFFTLEVAADGYPPIYVSAHAPRGAGSKRLVLVLGDRVVKGRAFDRLGGPAVGVAVLVLPSPKHSAGGTSYAARTTTDADGRYEIGGLATGPYMVSAYLRPDAQTIDRRDAEADGDPSGTTVVNLGSEVAEPLWTGVVRGRDGRGIPGPSTMWLFTPGGSPYVGREIRFDAQGRFSDRVPAGPYAVNVNLLGRTLPRMYPAAERLVLEGDRVQDVTVPGARLSGSLRHADTREPFSPRGEKLYLQPKGAGREGWLGIALGSDGTFATVGVLPGTYEVLGWPTALSDSSGRPVTLEVKDSSPDLQLELYAK
jgi:RNA polymerase sigma-70 factor (ECF subfamily)